MLHFNTNHKIFLMIWVLLQSVVLKHKVLFVPLMDVLFRFRCCVSNLHQASG